MTIANDRQVESAATPRAVLVIDADPALFGLLKEWLAECGYTAVEARAAHHENRFELVVVDIAFPRQGGAELIARIANEHPGIPIVALSSGFCAGVKCRGEVARALGVAGVLPKPVPRDALQCAVRDVLGV